jgi:hypothetical protein
MNDSSWKICCKHPNLAKSFLRLQTDFPDQ